MTSTSTTAMLAPVAPQCDAGPAGLLAASPGGDFAALMNQAISRPGSDPGQPAAGAAESGKESRQPGRVAAADNDGVSDSDAVDDGSDDSPSVRSGKSTAKPASEDATVPPWLASLVAGAFWRPSLCAPAPETPSGSAKSASAVAGVGSEARECAGTSPMNLLSRDLLTAPSTGVSSSAISELSPLLSKLLHSEPAPSALGSGGEAREVAASKPEGPAEKPASPKIGLPNERSEAKTESASPSSVDSEAKNGAGDRNPAQPNTGQQAHSLAGSLTETDSSNSAVQSEHGMSDAPPPGTMLAMAETTGTSRVGEQNLPNPTGSAEMSRTSGRVRAVAGASLEPDSTLSGGGSPGVSYTAGESADRDVATSSGVGTSASAQAAIEHAALGVPREAGASVSLILRPDANTQLALHVKWNQGQLDALAVVERGDFSTLGASWSQLQHRLAEQGVRLAPLAQGGDNFGFSTGGQSSPGKQDAQTASAPNRWGDQPALATKAQRQPSTPIVRRPTLHGREWWA